VSRKRVARIMRINGWVGESARKGFKTTTPDQATAPAPDLVARGLNPAAPNVTWAGDLAGGFDEKGCRGRRPDVAFVLPVRSRSCPGRCSIGTVGARGASRTGSS
jgi:transposase InsO family protein